MWRKFFLYQEEKEQDNILLITQALEEEINAREDCPIDCPEVTQQRQQFITEYYRQLVTGGNGGDAPITSTTTSNGVGTSGHNILWSQLREQRQNEQNARRENNQHDLNVPVVSSSSSSPPAAATESEGLDSIYLAQ